MVCRQITFMHNMGRLSMTQNENVILLNNDKAQHYSQFHCNYQSNLLFVKKILSIYFICCHLSNHLPFLSFSQKHGENHTQPTRERNNQGGNAPPIYSMCRPSWRTKMVSSHPPSLRNRLSTDLHGENW